MKKLLLILPIITIILSGCDKEYETYPVGDADFVTFVNQDRQNWDENATVIAEGARGDFLKYIDETPEILEIYNRKEKTAKFLSVENPSQYIKPGKCLVNTIPYETMEEMGGGDCSWRLFCGTEMNYDAFYAVELCGVMMLKDGENVGK